MNSQYFRLTWDVYVPGLWYLDNPSDAGGAPINPDIFSTGQRHAINTPLHIPLYIPGRALDFSEFTSSLVPVVNERLAQLLSKMGGEDLQLIPARIESVSEPYYVVNVLRFIRCIDDAASDEVQYWLPEDGRPELVGEYRVVSGLRIDPSKVDGAHLFRPWGWEVALIVSAELKEAIEALGVIGTSFDPV